MQRHTQSSLESTKPHDSNSEALERLSANRAEQTGTATHAAEVSLPQMLAEINDVLEMLIEHNRKLYWK